jgi:hypothetical protein
MEILTGTKDPFVSLPKKVIFGSVPLTKKLAYGFQYGMYILVTNFHTGWSIGLFRYILSTTFHQENTTLRFYDLFISSSSLIKSLRDEGITNNQQRQSWLKVYGKTLKPWEYNAVTGA